MEQKDGYQVSPYFAGLLSRCPRCGKGKLFSGFLSLRTHCETCELDYSFADSGDGPAVFIIFIVGFIICAGIMHVELTYEPAYWVHLVLWIPLTCLLVLSLLRPFKATLIALQYKNKASEGQLFRE